MMLQQQLISTSHGPWKVLVSCILLTQCTRKAVDKVIDVLLTKFSNPVSMACADREELIEILTPLGFQTRRADYLKGMSAGYSNRILAGVPFQNMEVDMFLGCGKYAQDSWNIFVLGMHPVNVKDKELVAYLANRSR